MGLQASASGVAGLIGPSRLSVPERLWPPKMVDSMALSAAVVSERVPLASLILI